MALGAFSCPTSNGMEQAYAQAILRIAEKNTMTPNDIAQELKHLLASRGRLSLLPKIAAALRSALLSKERALKVQLTVAHEKDVPDAKSAAEKAVSFKEPVVVVDPSLIGGWVLTTANTRVDASFKKQLLDLYRTIVA